MQALDHSCKRVIGLDATSGGRRCLGFARRFGRPLSLIPWEIALVAKPMLVVVEGIATPLKTPTGPAIGACSSRPAVRIARSMRRSLPWRERRPLSSTSAMAAIHRAST